MKVTWAPPIMEVQWFGTSSTALVKHIARIFLGTMNYSHIENTWTQVNLVGQKLLMLSWNTRGQKSTWQSGSCVYDITLIRSLLVPMESYTWAIELSSRTAGGGYRRFSLIYWILLMVFLPGSEFLNHFGLMWNYPIVLVPTSVTVMEAWLHFLRARVGVCA